MDNLLTINNSVIKGTVHSKMNILNCSFKQGVYLTEMYIRVGPIDDAIDIVIPSPTPSSAICRIPIPCSERKLSVLRNP